MRKLHKIISVALCGTMLFTGCQNSEETFSSNVETATPIGKKEAEPTIIPTIDIAETESPTTLPTTEHNNTMEDFSFLFKDISNLEFVFSSGVGAWCTILTVHEDGTFEGEYHDSDMGDGGEAYPNGTCYMCNFKGKFTKPEKVNDYTYAVKIEKIKLKEEPKKEEIIDETRYIYSEPYGLEDAGTFLFFTPEAPVRELPEEYINWISMNWESKEEILSFYGIYNVNTKDGFSSYEKDMSSDMDDELESIEEKVSVLENKLYSGALSQIEMNQVSKTIYQLWDDELNSIWKRLKEKLDPKTMKALTEEERKWITSKENKMKAIEEEYHGASLQALEQNDLAAKLTRKRVYELAEYLR